MTTWEQFYNVIDGTAYWAKLLHRYHLKRQQGPLTRICVESSSPGNTTLALENHLKRFGIKFAIGADRYQENSTKVTEVFIPSRTAQWAEALIAIQWEILTPPLSTLRLPRAAARPKPPLTERWKRRLAKAITSLN